MARTAVVQHKVSISLACSAFGISETCYRYEAKRCAENDEIAHWLERLTDNNRNGGGRLVLPVPAQREGIWLEAQADLSYLSGDGIESADQIKEADGAGEAGRIDGTGSDQPSLVDGFHARPVE